MKERNSLSEEKDSHVLSRQRTLERLQAEGRDIRDTLDVVFPVLCIFTFFYRISDRIGGGDSAYRNPHKSV